MTAPLDPAVSAADAADRGRALRSVLHRSAHATYVPSGRDPVAILEQQHADRLAGLVPVRIGRMLQSPFAYFRGSAAVMAADLANESVTGHDVMACGDAHILNFGLFASPERRLLFDLNDFDEAAVAPWEWDVKRCAASSYIAARDDALSEEQAFEAAEAVVRSYRSTMRKLCERSVLERYYFRVETEWLEQHLSGADEKMLRKAARKASRRTSERVLERITTTDDHGRLRIVDQPPIMVHVSYVSDERVVELYEQYRATLRADVALVLSQYRPVDVVMRVVGVGSVGTRCFLLALQGPADEPLFLQIKEAPPSVLRTYGGIERTLPLPEVSPGQVVGTEGHRVVTGQWILQAQSDPFLGWIRGRAPESTGDRPVDYYVRQFKDQKGSVEIETLSASQLVDYSGVCGALLARAHSQSPAAAVIAHYLGSSDAFDRAVATWSRAYADQIEADYAAVEQAVREARLPAETGV